MADGCSFLGLREFFDREDPGGQHLKLQELSF